MPAAVMQLSVLVFAVALCTADLSSAAESTSGPVTSTNRDTSSTRTSTNDATLSTGTSTNLATLSTGTSNHTSTLTNQNTSAVPPHSVSTSQTSPTPSIPAQTDNRTEGTSLRPPAQSTTANFTSNQTDSSGPSVQTTTNITDNTTVKATSAGLSPGQGKGHLAANPGLVAIICIFCVIFVLVLVVALIKCVNSPRAKFERLEDVPMGKVTENAPFAQYSK